MSDKIDPNDEGAKLGLEGHAAAIDRRLRAAKSTRGSPSFMSGSELSREYPQMREPIIEDLLREGEIMNIIAAPKTGKSWMSMALALAVSHGQEWLGFKCVDNRVLVIDNELHRETLASRYVKMCYDMKLPVDDLISFMPLRGQAHDLKKIETLLDTWIKDYGFKLIILDAFYRFIPENVREEDNAQMTGLYNLLDTYAEKYQCAFAVVHHTSKGLQGGKSVTDVGSGAGVISRAADVHLVLRQHEEPDHIVLDAAVRSWKQIEPMVLKKEFPLWTRVEGMDATALAGAKPKKKSETDELTRHSIIAGYFTDEPQTAKEIVCRARENGHKKAVVEDILGALRRSEYAIRLDDRGGSYLFGTNHAKLVDALNKSRC